MTLLLALLVVLGAAFAAAHFLRASTGALIPSTLFAIALFLYIFGAFNVLEIGFVVALVVIGVGIVVALIRIRPSGWMNALRGALTPAVVLFILLAIAAFFLTRNMQLASWDEFSHWGTTVKATFLEHSLSPYNPVDLAFRSYPPALTLHEFFFMKLGGTWHEGTLFWAYQMLFYALFLPFTKRVQWRRAWILIPLLPLVILTPILTSISYDVILVDPVLGLLFGYSLALVYTSSARSKLLPVHLALATAFLVLTKDSGTFFAILALVLYAWKLLIEFRPRRDLALWRIVVLRLGIPVLATIVVAGSWKVLLAVRSVPIAFSEPINLGELGTGRSYWPDVLQAFGIALRNEPISIVHGRTFSHVTWLVGITLVLLIIEWAAGRQWSPRRAFAAPTVILGGAVIYTVGLLVLYLYRFVEYEAVRLASFGRYLGTYWAGAAMFVSLVAIAVACDPRARQVVAGRLSRGLVLTAVWTVAVVILAPISAFGQFLMNPVSAAMANRASYLPVVETADRGGVSDDDRIWIISEHTQGFDFWVLRYEMMPSSPNDWSWSIGTPKDSDDVWTTQMTAAEWSSQLVKEEYDYVLIYRSTNSFVTEFGSLFADRSSVGDNTVFKVDVVNGRARLIQVG